MKKEEGQGGNGTRADLRLISSQEDKPEVHPRRQLIDEVAELFDEDILLADGYDAAIMGMTDSWSGTDGRCLKAVYDKNKCIEILMEEMDGDLQEATEYFEFNVSGAYAGPNTPIFMDVFDNDIMDKGNDKKGIR